MLQGKQDPALFREELRLAAPVGAPGMPLPTRRVDVDFAAFSQVLSNPIFCYPNAPLPTQVCISQIADFHVDNRVQFPIFLNPIKLMLATSNALFLVLLDCVRFKVHRKVDVDMHVGILHIFYSLSRKDWSVYRMQRRLLHPPFGCINS